MPKQKRRLDRYQPRGQTEWNWMRKGLDINEVLSLAKQWRNLRFWTSIWCKIRINFDPNDPRKKGVLQRWYKAVSPLLKVIMELVAI
jgi:hypothetical protein